MAGLLSGWLGENPFYQGFDERRNSISQFGLGLMSGSNPQEGFQKGIAGAIDGRQRDDAYATAKKAEAERQKAISATTEWLRGKAADDPFAADMVGLVEAGALTPNAAFSEYARVAQGGASDWSKLNDGTLFNQRTGETMQVGGVGGMTDTEYGLTPIWGQFADGSFGYGVQGKDGSFKKVDTGDLKPLDPRSLSGERAAGTQIGKAGGLASTELAGAAADAERISMQIQDLKSHPGLDEIFGKTLGIIPNQWGPTVPGTNKANAMARIEQMSGNAFLNGRQLLKGGGAITDMESNKAEAAFARLSTAQTKEEFLAGLNEFEAALRAGLAKLQAQAAPFSAGASSQSAVPGGQTSNGLQWSIEP